MFRKIEKQFYLEEFILPFEGQLRADNCWIKLAKIIPWDIIEERYAELFPSNRGQMAKPVRMALGLSSFKKNVDTPTANWLSNSKYLSIK